jgi:hypothetical protein
MEQTLLAIDPGFTQSAFVVYDGHKPLLFGKWANATLLRELQVGTAIRATHCAIELIGHYGTGMAVGAEVFWTCIWTGRLMQVWWDRQGGDKFGINQADLIKRPTVKAHVCGAAKASDANVRQALIDRWGGESVALGGKKCKRCKGKGYMGNRRMPCGTFSCGCHGGLETPPGPLKEMTADCWQALALGVYWFDAMSVSKLEVA